MSGGTRKGSPRSYCRRVATPAEQRLLRVESSPSAQVGDSPELAVSVVSGRELVAQITDLTYTLVAIGARGSVLLRIKSPFLDRSGT